MAPVSREALIGVDQLVPVLDGSFVPYVSLDNAASTPAFRCVAEAVDQLLPFYSGVHRGTGYKSRLSTHAFERSREIVGEFVGADPDDDVVVFTKNTTEAINRIARSITFGPESVVLTTMLEHHSNDLPWRAVARTEHVRLRADGGLDLEDLDHRLAAHAGKVALLVVSGASNVTGVVQPVHDLAARVHAAGGRILVDAAQLAAHRPIDMRPHDDPGHLDFVVLSAHKMYAPYGTGALIGARQAFASIPDHAGGGTVHAVSTNTIAWADLPDREEAGSPNVVGAVALATAIAALTGIGLERIAAHERELTRYAVERLSRISRVRLHGPPLTCRDDKVGVIPLTVDGIDHGLVAAVLGYEHGVGVRSGCFCAHPYIGHLLGLSRDDTGGWITRAEHGDKRGAPGMVRISIGCYNDTADIDRAVAGIKAVVAGQYAGEYRCERDGSFHPAGYVEPMLFAIGQPAD